MKVGKPNIFKDCAKIIFSEKVDSRLPSFNCFAYHGYYSYEFNKFAIIDKLLLDSICEFKKAKVIAN